MGRSLPIEGSGVEPEKKNPLGRQNPVCEARAQEEVYPYAIVAYILSGRNAVRKLG